MGLKAKNISLVITAALFFVLIAAFIYAANNIMTVVTVTTNQSKEDIYYVYNFTINNTHAANNITRVIITVPDEAGMTINASTNGTNKIANITAMNTTSITWVNESINGPLIANLSGATFWFNASAATPGLFNFTIDYGNDTNSLNRTYIQFSVNDTTAPYPVGTPTAVPASGVAYNASDYNFSATWNDNGNGNFDTVQLNFNGTLLTMSNISTANRTFNYTLKGDYFTAATYNYSFFANDTAGNANYTINYTFTIAKAAPTIKLLLENRTSSITAAIDASVNMNLTLTNCIGNVSLYWNGTLINHIERQIASSRAVSNFTNTSIMNLSRTGLFNVTVYYYANANYTDASNTLWINVASANGTAVNRTDQNITINQIITSVLIPDNSSFKNITVPVEISENQPIDLDAAAISGVTGNATLLENITLERDGATNNYTIILRGNTSVYGGPAWDGKIYLPMINHTGFTEPTGTFNVIASMGSAIELNFSGPVKIVLSGMAGKHAAWTSGALAMIDIPTVCDSATNPTNLNAGNATRECYIDSGTDLVIWTYHFTTFAAYTPTPAAAEAAASSSSSGGCLTSWTCTNWGACINGQQTRICSLIKSYCYGGKKPAESQYCTTPSAPAPAVTPPATTAPALTAPAPITGEVAKETKGAAVSLQTWGILAAIVLAAIVITAYSTIKKKK
jgi:hypothetical protein